MGTDALEIVENLAVDAELLEFGADIAHDIVNDAAVDGGLEHEAQRGEVRA